MKRNKIKQVQKTLKNNDLIMMFNQMVGEGNLNTSIVIPKYELILEKLELLEKLLRKVFSPEALPDYVFANYGAATNNFIEFADKLEKERHECTLESKLGKLTPSDIQKLNQNQENFMEWIKKTNDKYDHDDLKEVYFRLKDGEVTGDLIIAVRDIKDALRIGMKNESHDLENKHDLKMDFIINYEMAYLTLMPSVSVLDFKLLFIDDAITDKFKTRILLMVHLFYKNSMVIIDQITKPDIDISEFSSVFIENIENIKHIPELRSCSKAFSKISNSVGLLEQNFGGYYKEFAANKNPGSIIENFVLDVASESEVDLATTAQFKKIVSYYRTKMAGRVNDPRISGMLDMVSKNISLLEE